MRSDYPHFEGQSSLKEMSRPVDKNSSGILSTSLHPHSQIKPVQTHYHMLNKQNMQEAQNERPVLMYGSDFKSTLLQHPPQEKYTNYVSEYNAKFPVQQDNSLRNRTHSEFKQSQQPAGNHRQVYP